MVSPQEVAPELSDLMRTTAGDLIAALTRDQRERLMLPFDDIERLNWHFTPVVRRGLPLKDLTPWQQALAHALIASGVSQSGYIDASRIMSLEQVLHDYEPEKRRRRDAGLYYPRSSRSRPWTEPGVGVSRGTTSRSTSRLSTGSFGPPRRCSSAPILPRWRRAHGVAPGCWVAVRTPPVRLSRHSMRGSAPSPSSTPRRRSICRPTTRPSEVYFAWAGGLKPGEGHYYAIQSPEVFVEYDNTQDGANHIHSVWHDYRNDFARDLLGIHYREEHHGQRQVLRPVARPGQ